MLRLMPNVRQTAAFVAPLSSAAITAASFSASIAGGFAMWQSARWNGQAAATRFLICIGVTLLLLVHEE